MRQVLLYKGIAKISIDCGNYRNNKSDRRQENSHLFSTDKTKDSSPLYDRDILPNIVKMIPSFPGTDRLT